jgi:hypothetical protein
MLMFPSHPFSSTAPSSRPALQTSNFQLTTQSGLLVQANKDTFLALQVLITYKMPT